MVDISELRKRQIAEQFRRETAENNRNVFDAADALAHRYGMSRREVLDVVKEILGSLPES